MIVENVGMKYMRQWSWLLVVCVLVGRGAVRADDKANAKKVTYDDDVRPILREHCFSCHNQNRTKGGLALDSYAALMEGGSSGEVVFADDLDSSRLWALITHAEEPAMPPMAEKLPKAKLDVIERWITGGLLENKGSKAGKKKHGMAPVAVASGGARPKGPPAMPQGVLRQPVLYTSRAPAVSALAASPWAPLVAVAGYHQVVLYRTDTAECVGVLPFPEGVPYVLRFSRNGAVLLAAGGRGGQYGCAVVFDVKTGKRLVKVGDELDAVLAADINDDHTRIALGGPERLVRIYSTETGELLHTIKKHTDWVLAIRFSPDGVLLATADRSNGLFVWEADTAREYLDLRGHSGPIWEVAWRPDSNVLASAGQDGSVRLWEMNNGRQIKRIGAHGGGVCWVSFSQDSRLVSAGNDRTVKLWSGDGKGQRTFPAFSEPALRAVMSFDGKRVIGGDWGGSVRMWDAAGGKLIAELPPNPPTLEMRLATAKKAYEQAVSQAAKTKAAWDALHKQVAAKTAERDGLRKTLAAQQTEQKQVAARLATLTATSRKTKTAIDALKKKLAGELQPAKTRLAARRKELETQSKTQQAAAAEVAKALAAAKTPEQKKSLGERAAQIGRRLNEIKTQLAGIAAEQKKLETQIAGVSAEMKRFTEALAATAREQKTLAAKQGSLAKSIPATQSRLATLDKQLAALAKPAAAARQAWEQAEAARQVAEGKRKAIEAELAAFRAMPQKLAAAVQQAAAAKQQAETKLAGLTKTSSKIEADLKQVVSRIDAVTKQIQELQKSLAASGKQKTTLDHQLKGLQAELAKLKAAMETAQEQLDAAESQRAAFQKIYGHYFGSKPDRDT